MARMAYKIAEKRVRVVEESLEEWKIDHIEAEIACEAEQLVAETSSLKEPLARLEELTVQQVPDDITLEMIDIIHEVWNLIEKAVRLFTGVRAVLDEMRQRGYIIERMGDFAQAESQVKLYRDRLVKKWSLPSRETFERSGDEIRKGLYRRL